MGSAWFSANNLTQEESFKLCLLNWSFVACFHKSLSGKFLFEGFYTKPEPLGSLKSSVWHFIKEFNSSEYGSQVVLVQSVICSSGAGCRCTHVNFHYAWFKKGFKNKDFYVLFNYLLQNIYTSVQKFGIRKFFEVFFFFWLLKITGKKMKHIYIDLLNC